MELAGGQVFEPECWPVAHAVRRRATRVLAASTTGTAVALTALLVWHSSSAAFTTASTTPTSGFSAGSVSLSDDDSGGAMFTATGLQPGSFGSSCLTVTYGGSVTSQVRLYVAPGQLVDAGIAPYLTVTVEEGSGGSFASCTGFVATATDYGPALLSSFASTATGFGSGVGAWTPTASGQTKVYRITYQLTDVEAARSTSAQLGLTWQAQST